MIKWMEVLLLTVLTLILMDMQKAPNAQAVDPPSWLAEECTPIPVPCDCWQKRAGNVTFDVGWTPILCIKQYNDTSRRDFIEALDRNGGNILIEYLTSPPDGWPGGECRIRDGSKFPASKYTRRYDVPAKAKECYDLLEEYANWHGVRCTDISSTPPAPPDPDGVRSGALVLDAPSAVYNPQYHNNKSLDRANGDAVDYYSFTTLGRYVLGLGIRGQSINLDVSLEDADGNMIIQSWPPPGSPSDEWIRTTLDAGTYYIRVEAMEDGYTDYYVRFGMS